jgi:hypothetical protein
MTKIDWIVLNEPQRPVADLSESEEEGDAKARQICHLIPHPY